MMETAAIKDFDIIKNIVHSSILTIYPNYYPKEVVDFFIKHHSDENILKDIIAGNVYLLSDSHNNIVGTATIEGEYMNRVFVLPDYQGKGYGSYMMDFIEKRILSVNNRICVDSSLPAFGIYLRRGYLPVEYKVEQVENGRVLWYSEMIKNLNVGTESYFNLNDKIFISISNTENGDVSESTLFRYHQDGVSIWAEYSGGDVERGYLLGKFDGDNRIYFTYQHLTLSKSIRIGECHSRLEKLDDGRIRMYESWKWLNGNMSAGNSILEEKK